MGAKLSTTLKISDLAPYFQLPILDHHSKTQHLRETLKCVSLRSLLKRGPALIVFVKESCPTCRYTLPLVDRIYRACSTSKASVYVIAQEEGPVAWRMVESLNLQTPVLLDRAPYPVSNQYRLAFVPTMFYINCNFEIENVAESFQREELEVINQKISESNHCVAPSLFKETEDIPAFRPG